MMFSFYCGYYEELFHKVALKPGAAQDANLRWESWQGVYERTSLFALGRSAAILSLRIHSEGNSPSQSLRF